jgi:Secretion system C-terminal sorting domain
MPRLLSTIAAKFKTQIFHCMKNFFTSMFISCTIFSFAQAPTINCQKSLGGSSVDEAYSIQQTFDGGYIATGRSSNDGDVSSNHGSKDYRLIKLNTSGTVQGEKCFGGSSSEYANNLHQTADGGFIIGGYSSSNDGDVSGNHSGDDYWLVKLNPGVLALDLLSFTAQLQQNKTMLLSWSTSNEMNNDHFTIEKSKDGINFSSIGTVSASVKPQAQNNYSFTDNSVVAGIWYYRLKQTDKNDQSVYSKTIPVKVTSQTPIKIVPNPSANGKFSVDLGEAKKNIYITVTDNSGRNILSQQQSSAQYINLNLRDEKGIYYLLMVYDGGKSIQKLIVE